MVSKCELSLSLLHISIVVGGGWWLTAKWDSKKRPSVLLMVQSGITTLAKFSNYQTLLSKSYPCWKKINTELHIRDKVKSKQFFETNSINIVHIILVTIQIMIRYVLTFNSNCISYRMTVRIIFNV